MWGSGEDHSLGGRCREPACPSQSWQPAGPHPCWRESTRPALGPCLRQLLLSMERPSLCPLGSWTGQDDLFHLGTQATLPLPPPPRLQTRGCTKASRPNRCIATSDQSLDRDAGEGPMLTDDSGQAAGLVRFPLLVRELLGQRSCSQLLWVPRFSSHCQPSKS